MANIFNRIGNSNDSNEKVLKKLVPMVDKINALEPEYEKLSDVELKAKTQEFKVRLAKATVGIQKKVGAAYQELQEAKKQVAEVAELFIMERGDVASKQVKKRHEQLEEELRNAQNDALDDLITEAFAAVREAARRTIGQRHNDVQLIGGIVLHQEKVAEVKNGEGMALVSTLPLYLNALLGKSVHFVSLNNYSAKRDSYWMSPIYFALGMSVSIIQGQQTTGGQVGVSFIFDPNYDSGKENDPWKHFRPITRKEAYQADITYGTNNEFGFDYLRDNMVIDFNQCVQRDLYYAILDEVDSILIDGGRTPLIINGPPDRKTYATITFQNYFDMYQKLAGITNTAFTNAEEFHDIHLFEVVIIPANKPIMRQDFNDKIYKNEEMKFNQVVKEVEDRHKEGRPILIGTVSPEKSEILSDMMKRKGIPHKVLNTKLEEQEAAIIAQAGKMGAVTITANMVGFADDIILGGNPAGREPEDWQMEHDDIVRLGGLEVIGTELHEERRIDNKLRALAGCHGEPGSTQFYVSLEDRLILRFGGDRVKKFEEWVGLDEGVPIGGSFVNKSFEVARERVERHNFDLRKQLVKYDNVLNNQCKFIYGERRKILSGANLKANILFMVKEEMAEIITNHIGENSDGNRESLITEVGTIMHLPKDFTAEAMAEVKPAEIKDRLMKQAEALYEKRETELGVESMRVLERLLMLRVIDNYWVGHLTNMGKLRKNVGLQATVQRDGLAVYENEGYDLFQNMMAGIRHDLVHNIFNINITKAPPPEPTASQAANIAVDNRAIDCTVFKSHLLKYPDLLSLITEIHNHFSSLGLVLEDGTEQVIYYAQGKPKLLLYPSKQRENSVILQFVGQNNTSTILIKLTPSINNTKKPISNINQQENLLNDELKGLTHKGEKFQQIRYISKPVFKATIMQNADLFFGDSTIYLDLESMTEPIPKGIIIPEAVLFDFTSEKPFMYLIENHLINDNSHEHVWSRITKLISMTKNPMARNQLIERIMAQVRVRQSVEQELKRLLDVENVPNLKDISDYELGILLIIDQSSSELNDIMDTYVEWNELVEIFVLEEYQADNGIILSLTPAFSNYTDEIDENESIE